MKKRNTKNNLEIRQLVVFEQKEVRRVWYMEEWYFAVHDIVNILTDSTNTRDYIKKMRKRDKELSVKWGTICPPLDVISKDGRKRKENMSNLQGIFRIIQSIPSPKAEPFKLWLAKVGHERIEEIQDPEKAIQRARRLYQAKGYSDDWIEKRFKGIAVRNTATDEWKNRGAATGIDFAILTNEIYKGTFDMTAQEIKKSKDLDVEANPRDHMDEFELILIMLGEASSVKLSKFRNSQGVPFLKHDAKEGGEIAGGARKQLKRKMVD